jgi:glucose/arabinose dehydrogenase
VGRWGDVDPEDAQMRPLARAIAGFALLALLAGCDDPPEGPQPGVPFEDDAATEPAETAKTVQPPRERVDGTGDDPASGAEPAPEEVAITAQVVARGLEAPWEVVFSDDRVFVTERDSGAVRELRDDGSTAVVARLPVDAAGEGGLLGLLADPHAEELRFYAYLTSAQDNRIVRFTPGEEPEPILTGIPKASVHNGGRLAFGPDGMLYAATGDAAQPALAQDTESLAGKILRLRPDGEVPEDNPIAGSPVWSLGHRNVQGLAFTGDDRLYAAEFGPDVDDEINLIRPAGNYGWPEVTGETGVEGFVDPVFVRQPSEASWSGLAAMEDSAIPQWDGNLFAAGLRGERLWRLRLGEDGGVVNSEQLLVGEVGRLRQAVQAPDGSLWVLTSNRDGRGDPAEEDDRIVRLGPGG